MSVPLSWPKRLSHSKVQTYSRHVVQRAGVKMADLDANKVDGSIEHYKRAIARATESNDNDKVRTCTILAHRPSLVCSGRRWPSDFRCVLTRSLSQIFFFKKIAPPHPPGQSNRLFDFEESEPIITGLTTSWFLISICHSDLNPYVDT